MKLDSSHSPSLAFLATNTFWSLVSHVFARGTLVISAMILARSLDTVGFAAYSYFQLTISMLTTCTAMGMGVTASRYFAEFAGRKDGGSPPPLATLWLLSVFMAFIAGCIVFILPASIISPDLAVPRWLMAFGVVVLSLNIVPAGGVLGLERYRSAAIISALSSITTLAIVFNAATVNSPVVGMMAIVAGGCIMFFGQSVLIFREVGLSVLRRTVSIKKLGSILGFASPMFAVSILTAAGSWLVGRIILSGSDGEYSFSLYVIGMQWFSLAMLLPGIFSRVIFPVLVRLSVAEDSQSENKGVMLLRKTSLISVAIALVMTLLVAFCSPIIVGFYGPNFSSASTVLVMFSAIAILSAPANIIGNALVAKDNQRLWLFFTLVTSSLLVTLCYATVDLGVWAGVIALTFSSGLLTLFALVAARSHGLI
jgi:O-antigen/teichoic acid export membrane protein